MPEFYPLGVVAAVAAGISLRRGVRRRRGVWTPRSWRRFWLLLGCALVAAGVGLGMAAGVDHGVDAGMSRPARRCCWPGSGAAGRTGSWADQTSLQAAQAPTVAA